MAGAAVYGLAALAGVLTSLSPCVLPIVPILLASAAQAHPRAPLALAGGLAVSYALVGSVLAWAAGSLGADTELFRQAGAAALAAFGLLLMSDGLQRRFAGATAGLGDAGSRWLSRIHGDGLGGQMAVGLALGVVWSPCVGPTLGSAIVLASQGQDILRVMSVMAVFGFGAALPVLALAYLSRAAGARWRGSLVRAGRRGKMLLGLAMLAVGLLILSGADKPLEAFLVAHSPSALTRWSTRY